MAHLLQILSVLPSRKQRKSQKRNHVTITFPLKRKRSDDVIGMEMVNILKSSIKSREESKRHDADKLFLLALLDDFRAVPQY